MGRGRHKKVSYQPDIELPPLTSDNKPIYTATTSIFGRHSIFSIIILGLLFWTIIPLLVLLYWNSKNKSYQYIIYRDRVVIYAPNSKMTRPITTISSVSCNKNSRLFNYGDVFIGMSPYRGLVFKYVKDPEYVASIFRNRMNNNSTN